MASPLNADNRAACLQNDIIPFLTEVLNRLHSIDQHFVERRFRLHYEADVLPLTSIDKRIQQTLMLDSLPELAAELSRTNFDEYYWVGSAQYQYRDGVTNPYIDPKKQAVKALPEFYELRVDWNRRPILKKSDRVGSYCLPLNLQLPLGQPYWRLSYGQKQRIELPYEQETTTIVEEVSAFILNDFTAFVERQ
jgi:hypothetical protein